MRGASGPEGARRWGERKYASEAEAKKADWQRLKNDRKRLAEHNEYHRIWWHAKRREQGKPEMPQKGPKPKLIVVGSVVYEREKYEKQVKAGTKRKKETRRRRKAAGESGG